MQYLSIFLTCLLLAFPILFGIKMWLDHRDFRKRINDLIKNGEIEQKRLMNRLFLITASNLIEKAIAEERYEEAARLQKIVKEESQNLKHTK